MNHTKAVGDEHIAESRKLLGVCGTLGLVLAGLLRVETNVFQQHNVAVLHGGYLSLGVLAIGVGGENHRNTEKFAQACSPGSQGKLRNNLALRAAEMGHENDLGAFLAQSLDGRQRRLDTTIVGDRSPIQRNVEICANQNALALQISKILECLHSLSFLTARMRVWLMPSLAF